MAHYKPPALTPSIVKRPASDGKAELVYDGATPGLCIRKRKTNVYYYTYKFHASKRWLRIGGVEDVSLDEARKAATIARGRVLAGEDPAGDKQAAKDARHVGVIDKKASDKKTVDAMIDAFVELSLHMKKPRTIREYDRIIKHRIRPALGSIIAAQLSRDDVSRLHKSIGDSGHKPEANRTISYLSAICSWSIGGGWMAANPCLRLPRYREQGRETFLPVDQMAAVDAALDAQGAERKYETACLRFILATGARLSEARTLKWPAVDLQRGKATLTEHKSDGSIGKRTITFPPYITDVLIGLEQAKKSDVVFDPVVPGRKRCGADRNGYIPELRIERAWWRVRKAAGIKAGVRIHDLRHSFISLAISEDVNVAVVSEMAGHADISTTMRYVHLLQQQADGAAATVANAFRRRPAQ